MRRFLAFIVAAMATTFAATAFEPAIRDIDILVSLTQDGSAEIALGRMRGGWDRMVSGQIQSWRYQDRKFLGQ